jgi:hypothetical protein
LDPLTKAKLFLQGIWNCFAWVIKTLWDEYLTDLHPNKIPLHPGDYIWYAERWNGRFAMFGFLLILQLELIYKISIWEIIGVM